MQEAPTVPSAAGFRNIKPMTRHERRALKDKVALEKDRLMKRSGMSAKLYRENAPKDCTEASDPALTRGHHQAHHRAF